MAIPDRIEKLKMFFGPELELRLTDVYTASPMQYTMFEVLRDGWLGTEGWKDVIELALEQHPLVQLFVYTTIPTDLLREVFLLM